MIHWIAANKFRSKDISAPHPIQTSYHALLSSSIADVDVVTDWVYYFDIFNSDQDIPQWLLILQLASCIFGTLAWLSVATDGRLVYWVKAAFQWPIIIFIHVVWLVPIGILNYIIIGKCFGYYNTVYEFIDDKLIGWVRDDVLIPIVDNANQKPTFSTSTLFLFGIFLEDIPQLMVTFLIEDKINSDDPTGNVSDVAKLNLMFAIFDILHKIVEALDLHSDVHNTGYEFKTWIKAHSKWLGSLAVVSGNRILSASKDTTVKLWKTTKGKIKYIQEFNCGSNIVVDAVAIGSSKVMAACYRLDSNQIRVFNVEKKDHLGSAIELEFRPDFISLSPDSKSVLVSGERASMIQSFSTDTNAPLATYNQGATALAFLDDETFVSSANGTTNAFVWNLHDNTNTALVWNGKNRKPIHKIDLEHQHYHAVTAMSQKMFLIGDGPSIKAFEFANDVWTCKFNFKGHSKTTTSLTKVNESMFVSTSWDSNAKLWDITKALPCVYTFLGHSCYVCSSIYLEEEKAIATGDDNGSIAVWSIKKYLENNQKEDKMQKKVVDSILDHDISVGNLFDQNKTIAEA